MVQRSLTLLNGSGDVMILWEESGAARWWT
jgi:hypothetical protein